jgi:predicted enzyme related to lactoylglutathione lyase
MTEMKSYPPGDFCWTELATSDWKAAKNFYGSLFGWTADERSMGPDQPPYVMLQKNGKNVCALYENKKAPPAWLSYVSVASADDSAKKAKSLGAKVLQEPFDVMDVGRMASVQDPQDAKFAIWQAKRHKGADIINEVGAMCWNELYTPDVEASRKFYAGLFNWKYKISPEYTEARAGDVATGGIIQIDEKMKGMGIKPHWMPYFAVADADGAVKKAKSLGVKDSFGPQDIPKVGRFAVLADPFGARFAIIKPQM